MCKYPQTARWTLTPAANMVVQIIRNRMPMNMVGWLGFASLEFSRYTFLIIEADTTEDIHVHQVISPCLS